VLAIVVLVCYHLLQDYESFYLPCAQLVEGQPPETPAHEELFNQRFAFRRDVRSRAGIQNRGLADPHRRQAGVFGDTQPSTSPSRFQAGVSALVALPTGLVGELKMEGD